MSIGAWLIALFFLGIVSIGLMFLFMKACEKI